MVTHRNRSHHRMFQFCRFLFIFVSANDFHCINWLNAWCWMAMIWWQTMPIFVAHKSTKVLTSFIFFDSSFMSIFFILNFFCVVLLFSSSIWNSIWFMQSFKCATVIFSKPKWFDLVDRRNDAEMKMSVNRVMFMAFVRYVNVLWFSFSTIYANVCTKMNKNKMELQRRQLSLAILCRLQLAPNRHIEEVK